MLSYEKFKERMREQVQEYMSSDQHDAWVEIVNVPKINSGMMEGIIVYPENGNNGAIAYFKDMYVDYVQSGSIENIFASAVERMLQAVAYLPDIDESKYLDWKDAGMSIIPALVCVRINHVNLKHMVNRFMEGTDLAVVYCIKHEVSGLRGNIKVTNDMMEGWGIDLQCIDRTAMYNMGKILTTQIVELESMAWTGIEPKIYDRIPDVMNGDNLYIFTNKEKYFGAASILADGVMEEIAERLSGNYYLMPISVNDMMVVSEKEGNDVEMLQKILMGYNITARSAQEILSDQIYYYDRHKKKLFMATDPERSQEIFLEVLAQYIQGHILQEE